jgi:hypothetical protein
VEQYTQQFKISDQEVNEANDDNNSVQATAPSTTAPQTPQITTPTPTPASQTAIITQH